MTVFRPVDDDTSNDCTSPDAATCLLPPCTVSGAAAAASNWMTVDDCLLNSTSSSSSSPFVRRPLRDESLASVEIAVQLTILSVAISGNVLVLALVLASIGARRGQNASVAGGGGLGADAGLPLAVPPGVIGRSRKRLSRMNKMIVCLSAADLFVAFFNVLPQLLWDVTVTFRGNDALCRTVTYFQLVAMFASSYVLVATALDRYLAICRPLSELGARGATGRLVAAAWILALLFALPQLAVFGYRTTGKAGIDRDDCWAVFEPAWSLRVYITWTALAIYVVPAVALAFMYVRICVAVWRSVKRREMAAASAAGSTLSAAPTTTTSTFTSDSVFRSSSNTSTSNSARRSDHIRQTNQSRTSNSVTSSFSSRQRGRRGKSAASANGRNRSGDDNDGREDDAVGGRARRQPSTTRHYHHGNLLSKAKIRTIKLTVTVNVSYVICWGPFFISHVWAAYDPSAPYEG